MSKIKSLNTVLTVAKQKEENIGNELKVAESELSKNKKYLDDLQQYRNSYSDISTEKALKGVSAAMFRHYQGFLNSIDHGIDHQSNLIKQMNDSMQTVRENWQDAHQYSKAIADLIVEQEKAQEKIEIKREQVMTDEINLRNFLLKKRNEDALK